MKKTALIILAFYTIAICYGQTNTYKKNALELANLKGNVKQITITRYTVIEKFGEIQKDSFNYKNITKYDRKGNELESKSYNFNGSLDNTYIMKYDEKNNKIEQNGIRPDGSTIIKIIYDIKGNEKEYNNYNSDGSLNFKTITKYDSDGNKTEQNNYHSDGSLYGKSIYSHKSNLSVENIYTFDGSLFLKYIVKFDKKGNTKESNCYITEDSLLSKSIYNYDKRNNIIECNTSNILDNRKSSIVTYKYEYDYIGNWANEIEFKDGKAKYISNQEVEYY